MKRWMIAIPAICGLALTGVPAFFVFAGMLTPATNNILMVCGMLLWFAAAPFLIRRRREPEGAAKVSI